MGTINILKEDKNFDTIIVRKNIFDYLSEFHILDYYNLENEQEVNALCYDFNEFADTNCSIDDFLRAARFYKKIISLPRFSFFRKPVYNIYPYRTIRIDQLCDIIINPKYYSSSTEEYRKLNKSGNAKDYKSKHFDYVTFSGIFSKRHSSAFLEHSGLMVIDIDKINDVRNTRSILLNDDQISTEMLFISPGGHGLKWVIKSYPEKHEHEYFFQGVSAYLKKRYDIEPDQSGKDISRACFICHDPDVYINPKYL
jgi:hypothetical protein